MIAALLFGSSRSCLAENGREVLVKNVAAIRGCHWEKAAYSAFSLMELLVVTAIISLLTAMAVPAISSISATQNITRAAYEVSGLLEYARSEAVTRQTYVWVGFQSVTTDGVTELQMAAVGSLDGSGTNVTSTNLYNVSRVKRLKNMALSSWFDLKSQTRDYASTLFSTSITPDSLAANGSGITFQVGSTQFSTKTTVTFTPRGEAILTGSTTNLDGYNPYIDVSLRQTHGIVTRSDSDDISMVINGATGAVQVVRLQ